MTSLVLAIALRLHAHPGRVVTQDGNLISVAYLSRRETHRGGLHAVISAGPDGQVLGALLRPNGAVACTFSGYDVEGCVTLVGCVSGTACD